MELSSYSGFLVLEFGLSFSSACHLMAHLYPLVAVVGIRVFIPECQVPPRDSEALRWCGLEDGASVFPEPCAFKHGCKTGANR